MNAARRRLMIVTAACAVAAVGGLAAAETASAHVTVAAPGVTAGQSDAQITFRVPDESATASTVELRVALPLDHPLLGVLAAPIPGWTATLTQATLPKPITTDDGTVTQAVSEITWKAAKGAGITPGYFGQLPIIAGKLPDKVTSLTFKAIQTYSDGKIVSWIQQVAPGSSAQPTFPAPVLDLTGTGAISAHPTSSAPTVSATQAKNEAGTSSPATTTGIVLGTIGIALGAAALALTITRGHRSAPCVGGQIGFRHFGTSGTAR